MPQGHSEVSHWLANDESKLEYVVIDLLEENGQDLTGLTWEVRIPFLDQFFNRNRGMLNVGRVTQSRRFKPGTYRSEYKKILARGGEGVVFKSIESTWSAGSRSGWIKLKAYKDFDVVITGCDEKPSEWRVRPGAVDPQTGLILPDGDYTSSWKAGYVNLSYGFYDQHGKLRTVGSLGFTGPRNELEQYVGKVAIVKGYGEQFESGALQHPVFQDWRDDKDAEDCVFEFKE